jgi:hypothetical protein
MLLVLWQPFYYWGNKFFSSGVVFFSYWVAMLSFGATFFYYGQPFPTPLGQGEGVLGATLVLLGN